MENESIDHNTALAQMIETGDAEEVMSLLGHKDRLRCGGVIRTGIKVPKSSCTDAEKAKFKELEASGMGYEAIDEALGGKSRSAQSKLVPKNSDFFTVRKSDFNHPGDAEYILKNYADADSKVRVIPVWFSQGDIERAIHNGFRAFNGGGQLVSASFYEGKDLKVRFLPKEFKGGPVKKEDWKIAKLDPDNPVDPAGRKLDFGMIMKFHVAGINSFDEIICVSRSWYGASFSAALLRRVRSLIGRFDGLLNGEPFLQLSKVAEEVKDPKGNKVIQYIPVFELNKNINPMELARYAEPQAVVARARNAMSALTGPRSLSAPAPREFGDTDHPSDNESFPESMRKGSHPPDPDPATAPLPADDPFGNVDPAMTRAHEYLHAAAKRSGVTWPQFAAWACMEVTDGISVEDCDIDTLRTLAEVLKAGLVGPNKETFCAAMKKTAADFGVE